MHKKCADIVYHTQVKAESISSKPDIETQGTSELLNPSVLEEVLAEKKLVSKTPLCAVADPDLSKRGRSIIHFLTMKWDLIKICSEFLYDCKKFAVLLFYGVVVACASSVCGHEGFRNLSFDGVNRFF